MLSCPRCLRSNPADAIYCYYDGAELGSGQRPADRAAHSRLPHEFVFPTGRRCSTYDELAQGCQDQWDMARILLREGTLSSYLAAIGRLDLTHVAQKALAEEDADLALQMFLHVLPTTRLEGPRLDLQPRRVIVGDVRAGDVRLLTLLVANRGKGLLHGTLSVGAGGRWLSLPEATRPGQVQLKTLHEQPVTLRVDPSGLAAPQTYLTKLTLITNGGIVELPVSLDLLAHPFREPPFQGVDRPRAMAERMRQHPRAAVQILEGGAVSDWFKINGWTYPVQGSAAPGVGAVQQFFEAMGLAKPPVVSLSHTNMGFFCTSPQPIRSRVTLQTSSRKWVYAHVSSDVPWLRPDKEAISGPQQAAVSFTIEAAHLEPGRCHEGQLRLIANGGHSMTVRVRAEMQPQQLPMVWQLLRPFLAGALTGLMVRLLLAVPADLYARLLTHLLGRMPAGRPPPGTAMRWLLGLFCEMGSETDRQAGSLAEWVQSPLADPAFLRHFVVATWWVGALIGGMLLWRRGYRTVDVARGVVAGAVLGVACSATCACLLALADIPARWLLHGLAGSALYGQSTGWFWTPAWIVLAASVWAVMGATFGLLLHFCGAPGRQLLQPVVNTLNWLLRLCGLRRLAFLIS